MPINRLNLNFNIVGTEERSDFVQQYIQQPEFQKKPLTEDELETIANYILWGKDSDGLSATQRKEIQIETRNKTWQRDDIESLDGLLESPTFNEATVRKNTEARTRIQREVFDRSHALNECPPYMRAAFQELFKRIDKLELCIHFWEFHHGRRKEPPRASLLKQFSEAEIAEAESLTKKWNQFKYLKQRHLIVELRREQFTMRDAYAEKHIRHTPIEPELEPINLDFGAEIPVYPIGLKGETISSLAFKEPNNLHPSSYNDEELNQLLHLYWDKKSSARPQLFFDFCDLEHVYELFGQWGELEETLSIASLESNLAKLMDTLRYYIDMADLTEAQREILDLKIGKTKNQDIATQINNKYGKSYTANYISTIFRQKIIPKINETAAFHALVIENLCFEENFKKCNCCGKILLIDTMNFVRKARAKDGFSSKCKKCDRADRQKKKVN